MQRDDRDVVPWAIGDVERGDRGEARILGGMHAAQHREQSVEALAERMPPALDEPVRVQDEHLVGSERHLVLVTVPVRIRAERRMRRHLDQA